MKYYLKRFPDGHEYSPCPKDAPPREGYEIVDEIPEDIREAERVSMRASEVRAAVMDKLVDCLLGDKTWAQTQAEAKLVETNTKARR
jgi:hypothetical protein